MINSILIIDDEDSIRRNLKTYFISQGFNVETAADGKSGIEICRSRPVDVVLLDLKLPDMPGLEVLSKIKAISPGLVVIIITAYGDVRTAVEAIKLKADNFVLKPIELASLSVIVNKCLENYARWMEAQYLREKLSKMEGLETYNKLRQPEKVYQGIRLLSEKSSVNVLILGETGTGKGMIARIIHDLSDRREKAFVDLNCAGLSENLLESELFGHEAGAFTDARTQKRGLLEVAAGGSVFLDEIGDLSPSVQAKLLKVIEEKSFRRLGGVVNINADVRIMATSNIDLERAVKENKFREDLYYRLKVMPLRLPPLRERREDIMPLARIMLEEFKRSLGRNILGFSNEAEGVLYYYSWPGNIRELRNVIERAVLICDGSVIQPYHLPEDMRKGQGGRRELTPGNADLSLEDSEKAHIQNVLKTRKGNHSQAARILKIHRSTLIKKIKKYKIE
ncbi:MAG: sigma-54 dependent transcriptional regulator [Proteobacteria bacterium]|nr:sigma-54 dependent transcriptional regulator [Pseudomonadota bacterium]